MFYSHHFPFFVVYFLLCLSPHLPLVGSRAQTVGRSECRASLVVPSAATETMPLWDIARLSEYATHYARQYGPSFAYYSISAIEMSLAGELAISIGVQNAVFNTSFDVFATGIVPLTNGGVLQTLGVDVSGSVINSSVTPNSTTITTTAAATTGIGGFGSGTSSSNLNDFFVNDYDIYYSLGRYASASEWAAGKLETLRGAAFYPSGAGGSQVFDGKFLMSVKNALYGSMFQPADFIELSTDLDSDEGHGLAEILGKRYGSVRVESTPSFISVTLLSLGSYRIARDEYVFLNFFSNLSTPMGCVARLPLVLHIKAFESTSVATGSGFVCFVVMLLGIAAVLVDGSIPTSHHAGLVGQLIISHFAHEDGQPLSFLMSPLQGTIGTTKYQYVFGALIFNALVMLVFVLGQCLVYSYHRYKHYPKVESLAVARFPSVSIAVMVHLAPQTFFLIGRNLGRVVIGYLFVTVLLFALMLFAYVHVAQKVLQQHAKFGALHSSEQGQGSRFFTGDVSRSRAASFERSFVNMLFTGFGRWESTTPHSLFIERYGFLFENYHYKGRFWMLFEIADGLVCGVVSVLDNYTAVLAGYQYGVYVAVKLTMLILLIVINPVYVGFSRVILFVSYSGQLFAALTMLVGAIRPSILFPSTVIKDLVLLGVSLALAVDVLFTILRALLVLRARIQATDRKREEFRQLEEGAAIFYAMVVRRARSDKKRRWKERAERRARKVERQAVREGRIMLDENGNPIAGLDDSTGHLAGTGGARGKQRTSSPRRGRHHRPHRHHGDTDRATSASDRASNVSDVVRGRATSRISTGTGVSSGSGGTAGETAGSAAAETPRLRAWSVAEIQELSSSDVSVDSTDVLRVLDEEERRQHAHYRHASAVDPLSSGRKRNQHSRRKVRDPVSGPSSRRLHGDTRSSDGDDRLSASVSTLRRSRSDRIDRDSNMATRLRKGSSFRSSSNGSSEGSPPLGPSASSPDDVGMGDDGDLSSEISESTLSDSSSDTNGESVDSIGLPIITVEQRERLEERRRQRASRRIARGVARGDDGDAASCAAVGWDHGSGSDGGDGGHGGGLGDVAVMADLNGMEGLEDEAAFLGTDPDALEAMLTAYALLSDPSTANADAGRATTTQADIDDDGDDPAAAHKRGEPDGPDAAAPAKEEAKRKGDVMPQGITMADFDAFVDGFGNIPPEQRSVLKRRLHERLRAIRAECKREARNEKKQRKLRALQRQFEAMRLDDGSKMSPVERWHFAMALNAVLEEDEVGLERYVVTLPHALKRRLTTMYGGTGRLESVLGAEVAAAISSSPAGVRLPTLQGSDTNDGRGVARRSATGRASHAGSTIDAQLVASSGSSSSGASSSAYSAASGASRVSSQASMATTAKRPMVIFPAGPPTAIAGGTSGKASRRRRRGGAQNGGAGGGLPPSGAPKTNRIYDWLITDEQTADEASREAARVLDSMAAKHQRQQQQIHALNGSPGQSTPASPTQAHPAGAPPFPTSGRTAGLQQQQGSREALGTNERESARRAGIMLAVWSSIAARSGDVHTGDDATSHVVSMFLGHEDSRHRGR